MPVVPQMLSAVYQGFAKLPRASDTPYLGQAMVVRFSPRATVYGDGIMRNPRTTVVGHLHVPGVGGNQSRVLILLPDPMQRCYWH